MQSNNEQSLLPCDLVSLTTLVDYLAYQKGFQRENSYYLLETEFNVSGITEIKQKDFDRAIAFLVDLQDITIH
jgi:hypothetical protein